MKTDTRKESRKLIEAVAKGDFGQAERAFEAALNGRIGQRILENRKLIAKKIHG